MRSSSLQIEQLLKIDELKLNIILLLFLLKLVQKEQFFVPWEDSGGCDQRLHFFKQFLQYYQTLPIPNSSNTLSLLLETHLSYWKLKSIEVWLDMGTGAQPRPGVSFQIVIQKCANHVIEFKITTIECNFTQAGVTLIRQGNFTQTG